MSSFTDKIRNIFLEQDTVTVFSLYEQFTDSGELKDVIDYQKHQIRSIVNNLRKKEEIFLFRPLFLQEKIEVFIFV